MAKSVSYRRPKDLKGTGKRFMGYLGHYRLWLWAVAVLVVVSGVGNLVGTYAIRWLVELAEAGNRTGIWILVGSVAGIYLAAAIAALIYTQVMVRVAQKTIQDLRRDLFAKVDKLPLSFFDRMPTGDVMSAFTNDTETISDALNNAFAAIIDNVVQLIGTIACIFVLSWKLSLIVMAFYGAMAIWLWISGKRSKDYFGKQQTQLGALSGLADERIRGMGVVKAFNREAITDQEFDGQSVALRKSSTVALFYSASMVPMVMAISYANYAIVTIVGAIMAVDGSLALSALAPYLVFMRQTALPINRFTSQANIILNGMASAERIFSFLDETPEIDQGKVRLIKGKDVDGQRDWHWEKPDGIQVKALGEVRFENVHFSYDGIEKVLKGIDIDAKPGQTIALVGSTGAGKTTIANLLARFYDVTEGAIVIDGIDLREIRKADLRSGMGVVLQDTHLFTGTIAENIRFGALDATDAEVVAAAKLANADGFIRRLPQGYDTVLTSDGGNLSQGQRQLLAIARASISNPLVLILDEATASVDTVTERLIQEGMDRLMADRTAFVIAHRLSTVRHADLILVLENGRIIERGTHDTLLAKKGRYYELYTGKKELS